MVKKQIVGHLIDSAANNHQRFLRASGANPFAFPNYDQPFWVGVQNYQGAAWRDLVELWRLYNLHLAHVIPNLPEAALRHECTIGMNPPVTLAWIVSDYLCHLLHHLHDLLATFPKLVVVHFTPEYTDAVIDLIVPIQREEFGIPLTAQDQPDLRDVQHFYQKDRGNFWIALHNRQVVGSAGLLDIGNHQAALRKMFVRPEFRGAEHGA